MPSTITVQRTLQGTWKLVGGDGQELTGSPHFWTRHAALAALSAAREPSPDRAAAHIPSRP